MPTLPVDILDRDWMRELDSPALRRRFEAWRAAEPALTRFRDTRAVMHFLRQRSSADKDAVLAALLARARLEPIAGRVVLEAIVPGLKTLARRLLADRRCERDEMWSALMASAWEHICTYPLERRPRKIAANLLLDSLHDTIAALRRSRLDPTLTASLPCDLEDVPVGGGVEALIDAAVSAGAVSPYEAELILASRVDDVPLSTLASIEAVSFDTLKHRRQRAERRLRFFLGPRNPGCPAQTPISTFRGCSGRR